jgi:hypothetical protein
MAKIKLRIQLPEPCNQDWNAMPLLGDGRFCDVCSKCVIDFTVKTDREVFEIFNQSKETPCGRFREDQLNRNIMLPQQARVSGWRVALLTFGALFTTGFAFSQTSKPKPATAKNYASARPVKPAGKTILIKGTVKTREGQPLLETFIGIKGNAGILAVTDSAGNFRLKLPESRIRTAKNQRIVLTFSRVGYHLFEQPVSTLKDHTFAITLDALPQAPAEIPTAVVETIIEIHTEKHFTGIPVRYEEIKVLPADSYYQLKHKL